LALWRRCGLISNYFDLLFTLFPMLLNWLKYPTKIKHVYSYDLDQKKASDKYAHVGHRLGECPVYRLGSFVVQSAMDQYKVCETSDCTQWHTRQLQHNSQSRCSHYFFTTKMTATDLSLMPPPIRVSYTWPLCANMDSSTKPKVHNVSQWRTKPGGQATCTENLVKFGYLVSEICPRTDKCTKMLITVLYNPSRSEVATIFYDHYTGHKKWLLLVC